VLENIPLIGLDRKQI